jgi:thiol-disulfide isomerase/thioredoxin
MPSASPRSQPRSARAAVTGAAALALAACSSSAPPLPPGDLLAALALPTVEGDRLDVEPLRGRGVLVTFFSTSCGHCRAELPDAVAAAADAGAAALAVMVAGDVAQAGRMPGQDRLTAPVLLDDGALRRRLGIRAVPYTLVLGGDGRARRALLGAQGRQRLASALRPSSR